METPESVIEKVLIEDGYELPNPDLALVIMRTLRSKGMLRENRRAGD